MNEISKIELEILITNELESTFEQSHEGMSRMKLFKHRNELPAGAKEFQPHSVQAVRMSEDFEMEYIPGYNLSGRAGDYLVLGEVGGFFAATPEAMARYYEQV